MFDYKKYQEISKIINKTGKKTKIVAISKGISVFGENRVQEAKFKFEKILSSNNKIKLHLTGPLQTNKVKLALDLFDVFHTLDREKLLKELGKFPNKLKNKSFFVQVNTGYEDTKSGVKPEETKHFLNLCKSIGINNISGLMCIPPINENPKDHFRLIKSLSEELNLGNPSIGMSSDYLEALDFDPQYIRLGTLLFGERK